MLERSSPRGHRSNRWTRSNSEKMGRCQGTGGAVEGFTQAGQEELQASARLGKKSADDVREKAKESGESTKEIQQSPEKAGQGKRD